MRDLILNLLCPAFTCCYNPKQFLKNSWSIVKKRKVIPEHTLPFFLSSLSPPSLPPLLPTFPPPLMRLYLQVLLTRLVVVFLFNCIMYVINLHYNDDLISLHIFIRITAFVIAVNSIPSVILYTFLANGVLCLGAYIIFKVGFLLPAYKPYMHSLPLNTSVQCIHSETGFGPFLLAVVCAVIFLSLALYHFKLTAYNSDVRSHWLLIINLVTRCVFFPPVNPS